MGRGGHCRGVRRPRGVLLNRIEIGPANIRDVSFILANLRPGDRREILCQVPPGSDLAALAFTCVLPGHSFVAYDKSNPAMAFGFQPITHAGNVLSAWAFGTWRAPRTLRPIARFVRSELLPGWLEFGVTRIEARSIAGHHEAHAWLSSVGADYEAAIPAFGRDGEEFRMFAWTDAKSSLRRLNQFCD